MKPLTRAAALLLAALLLLSGCGSAPPAETPEPTEAPAPLLRLGWYRVLNGDKGMLGYFFAGESALAFYDPAGTELERYNSFLADPLQDGSVLLSSKNRMIYLLRREGEALVLAREDGTEYFLDFLGEDLLPVGVYEVRGLTGSLLGYLKINSRRLRFYDEAGKPLSETGYLLKEDGTVTVGEETLYTARYGEGGLRLTNAQGREYLLVPGARSALGLPAPALPAEAPWTGFLARFRKS